MIHRIALALIRWLIRYCPDYHIRRNPVRKKRIDFAEYTIDANDESPEDMPSAEAQESTNQKHEASG